MSAIDLEDVLREWEPTAVTVERVLHADPLAAFAALLDQPDPALSGSTVPWLWHWFAFTPTHARGELGPDGHPVSSPLIPSFPGRRRMYAGGRLRQLRPLAIGDSVVRSSEVVERHVRTGRSGQLLFATTRHTYTRDGVVVATEDETAVYRHDPPTASGPGDRSHAGDAEPSLDRELSAAPGPGPLPGSPVVRLETDPVTLFRFSALTYNSHRIHYDHPYATEVEGYPDLLVHGPLLALMMLEPHRRRVARGDVPAPPSGEFSFRFRRPVFCGTPVRVYDDAAAPHADGTRLGLSVGSPFEESAAATAHLSLEH